MKRSVVGIRRADAPVAEGLGCFALKECFPYMATVPAVLLEDNRVMLRLLHERKPNSLAELSELTQRKLPNLSRILRMVEDSVLVVLD